MAETGHSINLAHFSDLLTALNSFGGRYNPSNPALRLLALTGMRDGAKTDATNLKHAKTAQSTASNYRDGLFDPLDTLARRIKSSAKSNSATEAQLSDIEEITRKIKGDRAGTKIPDPVNPGDPHSISVSQQSYVNLASHLESLVATLQGIPAYTPNEPDLRLAVLQTLQLQMVAANDAVYVADLALNTARTARNTRMYHEGTGMVDIAGLIKEYVFSSSQEGAKNPDYIAIKGIAFTRLKK